MNGLLLENLQQGGVLLPSISTNEHLIGRYEILVGKRNDVYAVVSQLFPNNQGEINDNLQNSLEEIFISNAFIFFVYLASFENIVSNNEINAGLIEAQTKMLFCGDLTAR